MSTSNLSTELHDFLHVREGGVSSAISKIQAIINKLDGTSQSEVFLSGFIWAIHKLNKKPLREDIALRLSKDFFNSNGEEKDNLSKSIAELIATNEHALSEIDKNINQFKEWYQGFNNQLRQTLHGNHDKYALVCILCDVCDWGKKDAVDIVNQYLDAKDIVVKQKIEDKLIHAITTNRHRLNDINEKRIREFKESLEAEDRKLPEAEQRIKEDQDVLSEKTKMLVNKDEEIRKLQSVVDDLKEVLNKQEAIYAKKIVQLEQVYSKEITKLTQERDDACHEFATKENLARDYMNKSAKLEERQSEFAKDIRDKISEIKELYNKIDKQTKQIDELSKKITTTEHLAMTYKKFADKISIQFENYKKEIETKGSSSKSITDNVPGIKKELQLKEATLAKIQIYEKKIEGWLDDLRKRLKSVEQERDKFKKLYEELCTDKNIGIPTSTESKQEPKGKNLRLINLK